MANLLRPLTNAEYADYEDGGIGIDTSNEKQPPLIAYVGNYVVIVDPSGVQVFGKAESGTLYLLERTGYRLNQRIGKLVLNWGVPFIEDGESMIAVGFIEM